MPRPLRGARKQDGTETKSQITSGDFSPPRLDVQAALRLSRPTPFEESPAAGAARHSRVAVSSRLPFRRGNPV